MDLHVFLTARQVEPALVAGKTVLVVDVVRATSTMVQALASGASAIYPTVSTEDAIKLRASLGPENTLLCGERKGLMVEGFDLGNSPGEYTPDRVEGKGLVMSTTNGTQAFTMAAGAERVLAAAFLNLTAAAQAAAGDPGVVIICAGAGGAFSLDDAVCAGLLVRELVDRADAEVVMDDAAMAVLALAERFPLDADFLRQTAAGQALVEVGLDGDLDLCAQRDLHPIVPEMHDRVIRVERAVRS